MTKAQIQAKRRTQGGFTLIELMVVVAIIAILSTIGIGGFSNAQKKSRDARRRADVKTIQSTMISASDTNGNLDALKAVAEAGGKFPEDPKKDGRYLLYAPFTPTTDTTADQTKIQGPNDKISFQAAKSNSGVVCAALEIPNTGNATETREGALVNVAAAEVPLTLSDGTTFNAVPATGISPNISNVAGITYDNGSTVITPCNGSSDSTNCNLFCATF